MDSQQLPPLSPFVAIVPAFLKAIDERLNAVKVPCTSVNQRVRLSERITQYVNDTLPGLRNQYYAELTMLPPTQSKSILLDRLVAEAMVELKECKDWVQVRLETVEYVSDQLASLAEFMYVDKLRLIQEEANTFTGEISFGKDEETMSWSEFFGFISDDLAHYKTAFLYSTYIDWLLIQYDSTDRSTIRLDPVAPKVTQAQRALYYVYLHTTLSEPDFAQHPEGKAAAIRYIADANLISAKNFEMTYNRLTKFSERTTKSMAATIKAVIAMLDDYPAARQKAEEELKITSTK